MTYTLEITLDERKAIDWIGDRYSHGSELYSLLAECEWSCNWDDPGIMTIKIPENVAWYIQETIDASDGMPCWADELKMKWYRFCETIV